MNIHSVELSAFRNLEPCRIELGGRFNLIVGANAQGKTNLLEAISVLSELRSFRGAKLLQLVRHGQASAYLGCTATASGLDYEVRLELARGMRRLRVNGKAVQKQKDYIGNLPAVVFAPDDVRLSKGGPERRRRFLDRALFMVQPAHWSRISEYRQVLKRRNLLLKEMRTKDPLFEVYTEKLAELGAEISFQRHRLTLSLKKRALEAIRAVSKQDDDIDLRYETHLPQSGSEVLSDSGVQLRRLLADSLSRDRRVGHTTVGPHVEDLVVELSGLPAADYASQGQHRTVALALKIAEIEAINRMRGSFPVLLIDDLSSELDRDRRERLFTYLKKTGGQVLLTSTDESLAEGFDGEDLVIFRVQAGVIEPSGSGNAGMHDFSGGGA